MTLSVRTKLLTTGHTVDLRNRAPAVSPQFEMAWGFMGAPLPPGSLPGLQDPGRFSRDHMRLAKTGTGRVRLTACQE